MILIILNLFILESLLSVDNAAVLALMVKDLPPKDQTKALRYGIGGAFVFRGMSLFFAAWLIKISWLKVIGGLYLLYLVYDYFTRKESTPEELEKKELNISVNLRQLVGKLWSTIILVEMMDMAFSIDNIFAAVAMTDNYWLIIAGVFMGIIAMRFVAQWFVRLIRLYPSMETSAFIVIGLLAIKLITMGFIHPAWLTSHTFDFTFSGVMMLIFFIPLIRKNYERVKAG